MGSRLFTSSAALAIVAIAYLISPVPNERQQNNHEVDAAKVQDPEALGRQLAKLIQFRTVGDVSASGHVSADARNDFVSALEVKQNALAKRDAELLFACLARPDSEYAM